MKRTSILVLLAAALTACSGAQTTQTTPAVGQTEAAGQSEAPSQGQPSTVDGSGATSLVDAAVGVEDWCTLMPMDLAADIVPGGSAPQSQLFPPLKCTVSNGTSVLEISFLNVPIDPVPGAESIPDLGEAAYLERPFPDDAYLTVILGTDPGGVMYVEVAGHDGQDHKDDAIAVAQAVIAQLR